MFDVRGRLTTSCSCTLCSQRAQSLCARIEMLDIVPRVYICDVVLVSIRWPCPQGPSPSVRYCCSLALLRRRPQCVRRRCPLYSLCPRLTGGQAEAASGPFDSEGDVAVRLLAYCFHVRCLPLANSGAGCEPELSAGHRSVLTAHVCAVRRCIYFGRVPLPLMVGLGPNR